MGSATNLEKGNVSSSDSEDDQKDLDVTIEVRKKNAGSRRDSVESGVLSFSATPSTEEPATGQSNKAFQYDEETVSRLRRTDSVSRFLLNHSKPILP